MYDLEYYGNKKTKSCLEGEGYYVTDYESPDSFEEDKELQEAFKTADESMRNFYSLLDKRITDLGGNPDDYEA